MNAAAENIGNEDQARGDEHRRPHWTATFRRGDAGAKDVGFEKSDGVGDSAWGLDQFAGLAARRFTFRDLGEEAVVAGELLKFGGARDVDGSADRRAAVR